MSKLIYSNNASSTLTGAISAAATACTLSSAAAFPPLLAGQAFKMTFNSAANPTTTPPEIVLVTAVSGNNITSMVRGQEGTAAAAWNAGDLAANLVTAGALNAYVQQDDVQLGTYTRATGVAGTGNAVTASLPSDLAALVDGQQVEFVATAANTGATTFALTLGTVATGAIAIVRDGNNALTGGEIPGAGYPVQLEFSAEYPAWVMVNPARQQATETVVGLAAVATDALVTAGADDKTIITPLRLANRLAALAYATVAYVMTQLANYLTIAAAAAEYAPLASPALTGVPTAPTANVGTDTTQIATCQFVETAFGSNSSTVTRSGPIAVGSATAAAGTIGSTGYIERYVNNQLQSITQWFTVQLVDSGSNPEGPGQTIALPIAFPTGVTGIKGTNLSVFAGQAYAGDTNPLGALLTYEGSPDLGHVKISCHNTGVTGSMCWFYVEVEGY